MKNFILLSGLLLLASCEKNSDYSTTNAGSNKDPQKIEINLYDDASYVPPVGAPINPINSLLGTWGPMFSPPPWLTKPERRTHEKSGDPLRWFLNWNQIAIDASGLDHTPVHQGEDRVFGEQFGPARAARAMAIVHIAMFEAINAIERKYESYVGLPKYQRPASLRVALAKAAHDALAAMFPSQTTFFDENLNRELRQESDVELKKNGLELGTLAAHLILTKRLNDGSNHSEPVIGVDYFPSDQPGAWRMDPISNRPVAMGARWHEVKPFVILSAEQFRAPPPPALTSASYTAAFFETKKVGGDGVITPTERTPEQTEIGIFWAYDGTPSLCAPPRLYNQLAVTIGRIKDTPFLEFAHMLTILNVAMADAALAVWESKFHYAFWRPVTAIREADVGTGPSGLGDDNPLTVADPTFSPLGAPASNLQGPNFTPPFPSYPSGHAGFGGAVFAVLRIFYNTDQIPFTFVSDEYNGSTKDNEGNIRPRKSRSFNNLKEAEEENAQSRMYLGIHWAFDKTAGMNQGEEVASFTMKKLFLPLD